MIQALNKHTAKEEETVVFPMAETLLSPRDRERLSGKLNTLIT
ncbi:MULTISPECIES: hypothetical protein [unclassified Paenibacillus]|nr:MULTISPECIES: hypothetical protein [unclassified Paenibacillus]MDF9839326.1 hemerythrin-like domain-containing protein [Paenibacillus sp. PastF-2]MDF9845907.1 hemerythrin-like domain-containing protein [Paenibacillus sp. PastM-2]MDF9852480.1 hemerythrin-like domain-containing protein [Paenibacillus sp. PastF-1]MDH6477790.1 hemerythrin-like domain-containing protein [Paenibacillus sp. PastH-2]MDH6505529.1 hemerythrin-like domain-containing protein [Paenibacillus sp. PastM-3]